MVNWSMSKKRIPLLKKNSKGQSFLEMSVLFMCIAVAIFLIAGYVKRASEGRVYSLFEEGIGVGLYNKSTATVRVVRKRNTVIDTETKIQNGNLTVVEKTNKEYDEYQKVTSSL